MNKKTEDGLCGGCEGEICVCKKMEDVQEKICVLESYMKENFDGE